MHKKNYLIIVLFLVIAIDTMGISFAWPIFGSLFTGKTTALFSSDVSMQWRNILYGITMGISSLFMFLGVQILGDISDCIGRRRVLIFCLFGTSFCMIVSVIGIIFHQVVLLMFSRAFLGAISASQIIAQAAMIDISNKNDKASNLGIVSAANNIGFIVGPIIGSLLIDKTLVSWFGFTTPFYFAALLAFLNAFLFLLVYKETLKNQIRKKLKFNVNFKIFVRAFKSKNIRTVALIYSCFQIGWATYFQTNFLALIQKYNYSGLQLGYFLLWLGTIFCINLLLVVRLVTRLVSLRKITFVAFSVAVICCIGAVYSNEIGLWVYLLPMASSISLCGNAIVTTFSNLSQKNEQGWVMGFSNSIAALSWAVTPPIAGLLLVFGFHIPFYFAAILFSFGVVITFFYRSDMIAPR